MNNTIRTNATELHDAIGLLAGLLFGGLAGFGAMLLFAPRSGKKTRARIGQKSMEWQDRAVDTYDDLVKLSYFDNRKILAGPRENAETE
jgi:gas vesicle protein